MIRVIPRFVRGTSRWLEPHRLDLNDVLRSIRHKIETVTTSNAMKEDIDRYTSHYEEFFVHSIPNGFIKNENSFLLAGRTAEGFAVPINLRRIIFDTPHCLFSDFDLMLLSSIEIDSSPHKRYCLETGTLGLQKGFVWVFFH